jgi:bifunctional non-homologous end joining protein LigD
MNVSSENKKGIDMSIVVDSIALYFREGTSDKVYNVSLQQEVLNGYVVNFSYGRRGNNLVVGSKTKAPISLASARVIFDKLVKEKICKGYNIWGVCPDGIQVAI